jgi:hypothetical protein
MWRDDIWIATRGEIAAHVLKAIGNWKPAPTSSRGARFTRLKSGRGGTACVAILRDAMLRTAPQDEATKVGLAPLRKIVE